MSTNLGSEHAPLKSTGVAELDDILGGGLVPDRMYLLEGVPGSGKTTLALQFLHEGAQRGEPVLYLTLSETEEELRAVAKSHGLDLSGITIRELFPSESDFQLNEQYTMFHPSEVELGQTAREILEFVKQYAPSRVVFDSLSELRLLSGSPLRYRRQILAFKQFLSGRGCTTLMLNDLTAPDVDLQLQSIAHGVVLLEQLHPEYGSQRRRLRVVKYRGMSFRGGYHDFNIERGGLRVFPRLVAAEHRQHVSHERLPSGLGELDELLGGGLERGTSTLIVGSAGTGKSTIAAKFCAAAAERGQSSAMFLFDEGQETLLQRAEGLGLNLRAHVASRHVTIQQVDPAELSPGEFAHIVRQAADTKDASIVVIDSLNGYLNAMPEERFLVIQLHELLTYLAQKGMATILIGAHQGMIGTQMTTPVDASYLADAVLLLRYFEAEGEVRQAISVVKKRGGAHERTIREFSLKDGRIHVGQPLRQFRGVLTGVPVYELGKGLQGGSV